MSTLEASSSSNQLGFCSSTLRETAVGWQRAAFRCEVQPACASNQGSCSSVLTSVLNVDVSTVRAELLDKLDQVIDFDTLESWCPSNASAKAAAR